MKRIFILFAVLVLVLSFQHTKCDEKNMFVFEDVKRSDWFDQAVSWAVSKNLISSTEKEFKLTVKLDAEAGKSISKVHDINLFSKILIVLQKFVPNYGYRVCN